MVAPNLDDAFPMRLRKFLASRPCPPASDRPGFDSETYFPAIDEWDSYRVAAPQYAYGRHRGPVPKFAHPAAVMISLLKSDSGEFLIPLTLRPPQMMDHAGQVSLPGGRSEADETYWQTASREFGEELGCATDLLQPIGMLRPIYVYASRHKVQPVISVANQLPVFMPNAEEVAELLLFPLTDLIRHDAIAVGVMQRGNSQYNAPGFWVGDHFVWGATAMIMAELRSVILQVLQSKSSVSLEDPLFSI